MRALEVRDVDLKSGVINVRRALSENAPVAPKSGHERVVRLFPRLAEALADGIRGELPAAHRYPSGATTRFATHHATLRSRYRRRPSRRYREARWATGRKRKRPRSLSSRPEPAFVLLGRGGQIRTADLTDPNRARYQTALRPEWALHLAGHFWGRAWSSGRRMMAEAQPVKDGTPRKPESLRSRF
jgi:hypothetical protein